MGVAVSSSVSSRGFFSRRSLFVSLLFVIVLVFCIVVAVFMSNDVSSVVDVDGVVRVGTEVELRAAIDKAAVVGGAVEPTVIALTNDITLAGQFVIAGGKNITLTSDSNDTFYKLFFKTSPRAITVDTNGWLILDGVIITRGSGSVGSGITVSLGGTLVMVDGEISGHTAHVAGGGVFNLGSFIMLGGIITDNSAIQGGGVSNNGQFTMLGGVISGNVAQVRGGGVENFGGGRGFVMSGGVISDNEAVKGGGVYHNRYNSFSLSGAGVISNNVANVGGGVYPECNFNMTGGVISGNSARSSGGGVYIEQGIFRLMSGKISDNAALNSGGGVWVDVHNFNNLFVSEGVVFENNWASAAYNRAFDHTLLYNRQIAPNVTWTTPFTQGYNNYDISNTIGAKIS